MGVVVVSVPGAGHIVPLRPVIHRLRAAGVDVSVVLVDADAVPAALADVDVTLAPAASGSQPPPAEFARRASDPRAFELSWQRRFANAGPDVERLREVLGALRPDLVVIHSILPTAVAIAAAQRSDLPYVLWTTNLLAVAPRRVRAYRAGVDDALGEFLVGHGVRWSREAASPRSSLLDIVPTTSELVGDDAVVDDVALTGLPGPSDADETSSFDWTRMSGSRPFVYVSFGTMVYWQPEVFRRVFRAAKQIGLDVVASVGELDGELADVGDHVHLARTVPQREVLARAAAFVTHGGYNSACESLRAGTPMVVIPLALDQPVTAHYLERTGAALAASPDATEDELAAALAALVPATSTHRSAALRHAAAASLYDGGANVAERLLAVARA